MILTEREVLVRVHGVTAVRLKAWVERGWVAPAASEEGLAYSEIDVARCALIRELRDELHIDRDAVPVVLSLMDQVYGLRRQMRTILKAIETQPEDVRQAILSTLAEAD